MLYSSITERLHLQPHPRPWSCIENPPIKAVLQIEGALRCSSSMLARPATASLFNSFNTEPPAVNFDSAIMAALGNVTKAVTALLLLVVFLKIVTSQLVFANATDPPTSDANPAVIAEPENATDVSIFCHVIRDGVGTRFNFWRITRDSVTSTIFFNSTTGEGRPGFENFFVTFQTLGGIRVPSNLTIHIFNKSFDMTMITCGSGPDIAVNGTFKFRIIGKYPLPNKWIVL